VSNLTAGTSSTSQAVGKVHDYCKIDTFMAIVTNKISSPHPTSHFSNVTFVDSDLCEHVPFLFQTPLM